MNLDVDCTNLNLMFAKKRQRLFMFKNLMKITTTCLALAAFSFAAHAEGDAKKGERVFKKCKACHQVGEGAKDKVGPQLNNIFGRTIGSVEGFKYSKNMAAMGEEGKVWDEENIAEFLKKPKDYVKGTKMSFAGLKKEKDRENIIAYLKTFSEE